MKNIEKKYILIGSILLVWFACFSFINSVNQSFWFDELASIGFVRSGVSLKEMFQTYLYAENNLPLYSVILYFTYRIMPYGEQYLLIPSILFCIGGLICMAAIMYKITGKSRDAFMVLVLGCASNALIWQGAWEIRCYSMVFFFSCLTLYMYICKYLYSKTCYHVWYSFFVLLFLWTHWFACILVALYGLIDLVMVLIKKISYKKLLYYIPGLALYLPWFLAAFHNRQEDFNNFWPEVPEWKDMLWTILFYLSDRRILWYVCLITCAVILLISFYKFVKKELFDEVLSLILLVCVIAIGWVIGIAFLYSHYINPNGSLYVNRYFMVIAPHIYIITIYGISSVIACMSSIADKKRDIKIYSVFSGALKVGTCFLFAGYLVLCYKEEYIAIRKPFEEFEAVADYLVDEKGIWDEDSAFIASNKFCALDGFVDYYFNKRGYESPVNVIDGAVNTKEETRFYPNYAQIPEKELLEFQKIYILKIHMGYDEKLYELIEENYIKVQNDSVEGIEIWEKIVR